MSLIRFVTFSAAAALGLAAFTQTAFAVGEKATAAMKLTDGKDAGTVTLTEATAGVILRFELKGLAPGPHAVHVHETGKCDGDISGAGGIYNPLGAKHGFLNDEGPMAGDLPNIYASADGTVVAEVLSPFLTLSKDAEETLFDSDKTSIVIAAGADDYESEPDVSASARIACGVIIAK